MLELLAEGLPNKAIAARLGISDQTVKFHVSSISGKLGAANRTDAVRRAVRRGLDYACRSRSPARRSSWRRWPARRIVSGRRHADAIVGELPMEIVDAGDRLAGERQG